LFCNENISLLFIFNKYISEYLRNICRLVCDEKHDRWVLDMIFQ
jgi:hypothetical protein